MSAGKHNAQGFTLIELIVVVAVVAVLASLAAPSMRELIASSRVRSASSDFYAALLAARSEAIKRRTNTVVEPLDTNWTSGWTVKVSGITDPFLTVDALPVGVAVQVGVPAAATTPITYSMNGRASSGGQMVIFHNASLPVQARCVGIDPSGLPRMRTDTNRDGTDGCN